MSLRISDPKLISACMIIRDEEDMIEDCILSIHDWVDEIIIVDTGSKDKTISIIEKFSKVRIFYQEWQNDFSYHRNFSIKKATGDWIFIIDADERINPLQGQQARKPIAALPEDVSVIAIDVYNLYGPKRVAYGHLKSYRFFKRSFNPRYKGRIHNRPILVPNAKVFSMTMRLNHFGYDLSPEVMAKKYQRTMSMCKDWTKEDPENPESWLQLARIMRVKDGRVNTKELPEIYEYMETGLALCNGDDSNNLYPQIACMAGWLKHSENKHEEALDYGKKALSRIPDYLDAVLLMGLTYTYGIDIIRGEKWLQRYLYEQPFWGNDKHELNSIQLEHINDRALAYQALLDIENIKQGVFNAGNNGKEKDKGKALLGEGGGASAG